jgi:hypothetical protein
MWIYMGDDTTLEIVGMGDMKLTMMVGWKHIEGNYLNYHTCIFFGLYMNLMLEVMFKIIIIKFWIIHAEIYFRGNHIEKYGQVFKN